MAVNQSTFRIPATTEGRFFDYWLELLKPFTGLTNKESAVLAAFLRKRHSLAKVIKDATLLDKVLMGDESRRAIRESLQLKLPHFQVIMSNLRKQGIIKDNKIVPLLIPNLTEDSGFYKLVFAFDMQDDSKSNATLKESTQ